MKKIHVTIGYKGITYSQTFEIGEDETFEEAIEEIQEAWCDEFITGEFDSESYTLDYDIL